MKDHAEHSAWEQWLLLGQVGQKTWTRLDLRPQQPTCMSSFRRCARTARLLSISNCMASFLSWKRMSWRCTETTASKTSLWSAPFAIFRLMPSFALEGQRVQPRNHARPGQNDEGQTRAGRNHHQQRLHEEYSNCQLHLFSSGHRRENGWHGV